MGLTGRVSLKHYNLLIEQLRDCLMLLMKDRILMNRRQFLTTGIQTSSAALLSLPLVSCSRSNPQTTNQGTYQVGEQISPETFVLDSQLIQHSILELCSRSKAKVVVLNFFGGGAMGHEKRVGGLWCPDSFEDMHIFRYLDFKYSKGDVSILPVACAPVYSSHLYGQEKGVYMNESDNSSKYKEAVDAFVESTEAAVANKYLPVRTYYDIRLRNLFNRRDDLQPGKGYGPVADWQGRFRASADSQKYGTPTIWLLDENGTVLADPFFGNLYHEQPFEIKYTVIDVDRVIQELL